MAIVQIFWVMNSNGFYFIDDSCHFNYNRHVLTSFNESIGSWHRLGRVWLFALPSQFGLKGTQVFASLLFMLTIYISYRILILKKVKFPEWVVFAIGFQPVLFNISYSVLAELPAALLIVLSLYYHYKNRFAVSMILSSLIFMFRTEYYFVAGLLLLISLANRRWYSLLLIGIGPVLWFIISWIISGEYWRFFYDMMLHARLPKISEGIDWYYYLAYSPVIFGVIQTLFFLVGILIYLSSRKVFQFGLIFLVVLGGFLVHTLAALKGLNATCSVGQLRYLAVIGPVFGIVSVLGLSKFWEILSNNYIRTSVQVIFIVIMFLSGPFITPFHSKYSIENVSDEISLLASTNYPDYKILSNLHYLANSMDEAASGDKRFKTLTMSNLNKYDKALIVWDRDLESSPFVDENVSLKDIERNPRIKYLFSRVDTVDHRKDISIYSFYDNSSEFNRKIYEYFTHDQYCWENFEIRVYFKE